MQGWALNIQIAATMYLTWCMFTKYTIPCLLSESILILDVMCLVFFLLILFYILQNRLAHDELSLYFPLNDNCCRGVGFWDFHALALFIDLIICNVKKYNIRRFSAFVKVLLLIGDVFMMCASHLNQYSLLIFRRCSKYLRSTWYVWGLGNHIVFRF